MAHMHFKMAHELPTQEAINKINDLFGTDEENLPDKNRTKELEKNWLGNECTFSFKKDGYDFSGSIYVSSTDVEISLELPSLVKSIKGNEIEKNIRNKATKLLIPSKSESVPE